MKKKILIFYTSVGMGHKYIAQNIGAELAVAGFEVRLEDIADVQAGRFAASLIGVHQFINRRLPFFWSWLYKSRAVNFFISPWRLWLAARNSSRAERLILNYAPDVVISTQTTASAVVAYLKRQKIYTGRFGVAFSDFHLHPFWLYAQADFYLANIIEQKKQMIGLGIPEQKIFVCGITLKPKISADPVAVRRKLGLGDSSKVVLIGSGSLGTGFDSELIKKIGQLPQAQVLVVCGKNAEYKQNLEKQVSGERVKVFGFYEPMDELYAIADIYVGKPGGLTTAETLSWRLPVLVTHWLPGQEELNVAYLKEKGLIMLADDAVAQIKQELESGKFRKQLQTNPNLVKLVEPENSVRMVLLKMLHKFD